MENANTEFSIILGQVTAAVDTLRNAEGRLPFTERDAGAEITALFDLAGQALYNLRRVLCKKVGA